MRGYRNRRVAIALRHLFILGLLAGPGVATAADPASPPAAPATPAASLACGYALGAAAYDVWQGLGGEGGRLGCATTTESPSSPSPRGSAARVSVFGLNGEIVVHASGPHSGQAFAVSGCFYRLYVQFGGTGGWLGLPLGDAENTPDGSRQTFEGGLMRYGRALDDCEATPTAASEAAPVSVPAADLAPLDLFENAATGDRLSLAAGGSAREALAAGYQRIRSQARVLIDGQPGMIRLKLYQNDAGDVHQVLAAPQSEQDALAAGLIFQAGQGFVWPDPRPGTVALKQYRDPATGRTRLTAGPEDESDAAAKGFVFVRIEGYAEAP